MLYIFYCAFSVKVACGFKSRQNYGEKMKETVEFNTLFIMVTGEIYCKITLCIKLAGVPGVSQVKVVFTPAFYPRLVF